MIILKAATFIIVYLALLTNVQGIDSFSKIHKWPGTQIFVYSPFIDSNSVTWATCDRSESRGTESQCSVMRDIYYSNGTSNTLSCNVNIAPEGGNTGLYDNFKIVLFGKDRAILVSAQKLKGLNKAANVLFTAVHFPSCKIIQNNLLYTDELSSYGLANDDILHYLVTITAYDDKYDVIYKNKTLCNNKLCIMTIDSEGKIVTKPEILPVDNLGEASTLGSMPVSSDSVSKGQLLTQRDTHFKKENQVTLILPSGAKFLKSVKQSSEGSWISMTHDMIGFCDLIQLPNLDNMYFCAQYDHEGNLIKEMNLDIKDLKIIRSVHNLPGGGIILLNSEDEIIKIDPEGKIVPSTFKVENFSCEKGLSFNDAFIFEKDDRQICVSRACSLDTTPRKIQLPEVPTLDFAVKCFTYDTLKDVIGDIKSR